MAITTQDFDNAERDLKTVSATSNSRDPDTLAPIQNYNTRLGDQVDTLAGRLAKLGYLPPAAYASGIVFTANDNTKTIEREGFIYAPLPSELPFTTSGNWASDSTSFFVVQNSVTAGAQFADVVSLKAGTAFGSSTPVNFANYLGQKVSTVVNNTISNKGGKDYIITNVNPGNLSTLIGGVWVGANHDLGGGFYAELLASGPYNPDWFGAKSGVLEDSTDAFNAAAAKGSVLFDGTYLVNDITVFSGMVIEGSGRSSAVLQTGTSNGSIFLHSSAGDISRPKLSNFTAKTSSGLVTGARFWKQINKSVYTAFPLFDNIETHFEFEISYDAYFIFAEWNRIRDGFVGSAVGSQTHQCINSIPASFGQPKQTNLNAVTNSEIFRADNPNGAIDIAYGLNWSFRNTDFEQLGARAIRARGIFNLIVNDNCWFEEVDADELILADVSPSPNVQSTRPFTFENNQVFFSSNALRALTINSASQASVCNNAFVSVPAGCVLSNRLTLKEFYGNESISGPGASTFLDGFVASRTAMQISSSEMTSNVINSPQSTNQNLFPLSPTGLGSTNFTASGFTGLTDVSSALGLSGQAVQVTCSGSANALSYQMPTKLSEFLEGKTVTIVVVGWGDSTGGQTAVQASAWENVTPSGSNQTAAGGTIDSSVERLQVAYTTYTVGSGLSSLHFGLRSAGVSGTPDIKIEAFAVYLGEVKPEGINFH